MNSSHSILILGASYGLLLASKLTLCGYRVSVVGRKEEIKAIASSGVAVLTSARENGQPVTLYCDAAITNQPEKTILGLATPDNINPAVFDMVILAMQEPQYNSSGIKELMMKVAESKVPCLSVLNIPPIPFLKRLPDIDTSSLSSAYSSNDIWQKFSPSLFTVASPDPQAIRLNSNVPGLLQVTLPSNIKVAPFPQKRHQALLEQMSCDFNALKIQLDNEELTPRVRLVAHSSLYVPLSKWPMLIAGNCRCVTEQAPVSIKDAVGSNLKESRELYDWVCHLVLKLGAEEETMVPFERYVAATKSLTKPSSLARSLYNGATSVERIDQLVKELAQQKNIMHPALNEINKLIDKKIIANTTI